jgi:mRNA interferase RelE/StbE
MRRLDAAVADRIIRAVVRFAETGQGDVKVLAGRQGELRLRVGDWRVLFSRGDAIVVHRVRPRGEAYRDG